MKLDIGISSYGNPQYLRQSVDAIRQLTQSEWRLLIVDNNSPDPQVREVIESYADDPRIIPHFRSDNIGYAGAVNEILEWAETPYVVYSDNDAWPLSSGWEIRLATLLDRHHELAMVFPGSFVSYPIRRPDYTEILWGTGCFWMLNRARTRDVGLFDTTIGHQEEVDYQTRIRLAGWKIAADPSVQIGHIGSQSSNPAASERINQGVINWVNKWTAYFGGKGINYYSPNVIRYEDWPPTALYLEEWFKLQPELQGLNAEPETVYVAALGRTVDLIKVPRYQHLYRDRII